MKCWVVVAFVMIACGGRARTGGSAPVKSPTTLAERMIAMLPDGAQLLVEVDLARLRQNPVVGEVATRALAALGDDDQIPGVPVKFEGSPLAEAQLVMLASYGVGTAQAASVVLLATKAEVEGSVRLADDIVALGPPEWTAQLEARAGIAEHAPLAPSLSLMPLRDHATPAKAPGAVLRVTAQLSFDARVSLARQTGLETTPARLAIWADIVDDLAVIIDADAEDPGDKTAKDAAPRLARAIAAALASAGDEPALKLLGLTGALRDVHLVTERNWVRAIVTVGPRQLQRVVERARAVLAPAP